MADIIELWTSATAKRRSRREGLGTVLEDGRPARPALPIDHYYLRRNKEIFDLRTQFGASYADIARVYGLSQGHVQDICRIVARRHGFKPDQL